LPTFLRNFHIDLSFVFVAQKMKNFTAYIYCHKGIGKNTLLPNIFPCVLHLHSLRFALAQVQNASAKILLCKIQKRCTFMARTINSFNNK
jgi:hypothetical protein